MLILVAVDRFIRHRRSAQAAEALQLAAVPAQPSDPGRIPPGVFFGPGHTWLFLEESGAARVGINEFARTVLGRIDAIETREIGERVPRGDVLLKLRHGDRAAAFRAPVDGIVTEVNNDLVERHDFSDSGSFTSGWLCKLEPTDTSQVSKDLLIGRAAREWVSREVQRLKVFLAMIAPQHPVLGTTMQDGGLPREGLIDELSDAEWRKLQDGFFG